MFIEEEEKINETRGRKGEQEEEQGLLINLRSDVLGLLTKLFSLPSVQCALGLAILGAFELTGDFGGSLIAITSSIVILVVILTVGSDGARIGSLAVVLLKLLAEGVGPGRATSDVAREAEGAVVTTLGLKAVSLVGDAVDALGHLGVLGRIDWEIGLMVLGDRMPARIQSWMISHGVLTSWVFLDFLDSRHCVLLRLVMTVSCCEEGLRVL